MFGRESTAIDTSYFFTIQLRQVMTAAEPHHQSWTAGITEKHDRITSLAANHWTFEYKFCTMMNEVVDDKKLPHIHIRNDYSYIDTTSAWTLQLSTSGVNDLPSTSTYISSRAFSVANPWASGQPSGHQGCQDQTRITSVCEGLWRCAVVTCTTLS